MNSENVNFEKKKKKWILENVNVENGEFLRKSSI